MCCLIRLQAFDFRRRPPQDARNDRGGWGAVGSEGGN
jgi:hypothetical protein